MLLARKIGILRQSGKLLRVRRVNIPSRLTRLPLSIIAWLLAFFRAARFLTPATRERAGRCLAVINRCQSRQKSNERKTRRRQVGKGVGDKKRGEIAKSTLDQPCEQGDRGPCQGFDSRGSS